MSKSQQTSAEAAPADRDPAPPRGMSRTEKSEFSRICRLRRAAGRPVSPLESDLLADYLAARERLRALEDLQAEQATSRVFLKDRLALAAALDRAAATVRRLARDLQLIG